MPVKTLSPADDARHQLDPERPFMRESLAWVIPLADEGLGLIAYTWMNAFGSAGAFGVAFGPRLDEPIFVHPEEVQVPDAMAFDDWKVGPLHASLHEPLRSGDVSFDSDRLAMDFTFEAIHPPYAFSSHPEPFPTYYADDRFEQGGRVKGTVRIDGDTITLDGFAHRDHSWGARAWAGTLHYKWLNFLADDAAVHVMDLQSFGRSHVRGYVHRDGALAEIVHATFDYDLDPDFFHRRLAATFTDDAGRETSVRMLDATAEINYPISPRLSLLDLVGHAEVDGRPGVGWTEMSWAPEYIGTNVEEGAHLWRRG